jgi:phospholipase C
MKRRALYLWLPIALTGLALSACGGGASSLPSEVAFGLQHRMGSSPINHIVIIVQENRSFDNLFAKFPGADGATRGKKRVKVGSKYVDKWVTLHASPLVIKHDIAHCWSSFKAAYDNGKMDGFNDESLNACGEGPPADTYPYQYVEKSQIAPYWDIADQWVLADHMFQTQGSGSFTAHQDLIRGGTCINQCAVSSPSASTESLVDNPTYWPWGCDASKSVLTNLLTGTLQYEKDKGPFPCSNDFPNGSGSYETLRDRLDGAGVTWKYYTPCFSSTDQPGCTPSSYCKTTDSKPPNCDGSLLDAFDVIYPVRYGSEWGTNVSWPETNIFSDITGGKLPKVSWVIPEDDANDHPGENLPCKCDYGPSWVASVVNAVGESKYWNASVIIVLWDDWGGFYDNASPAFLRDGWGGLGFRVPMMVISPYAIAGSGSQGGYISHTQYEFGSILKYIEDNWNLKRLGTTDSRATSIDDVFNYSQTPRKFTAIPSERDAQYFIDQPHPVQHGDPE